MRKHREKRGVILTPDMQWRPSVRLQRRRPSYRSSCIEFTKVVTLLPNPEWLLDNKKNFSNRSC